MSSACHPKFNPHGGSGRRVSTRLSTEYADLGRQERVGGYALWEHASRFGVEASAHHWTDQLGAGGDELWTGDANAIFRFAQNEHVQMRTFDVGQAQFDGWIADVRFWL